MSVGETANVYRATCDRMSCGLSALYEAEGANDDIPTGWFRVALGGRWVHFDTKECLWAFFFNNLSIEHRPSAGGWEISSLVAPPPVPA